MFCAEDLASVFGVHSIAQVNRTLTRQIGTVRGMHYQAEPDSEFKIVSCLSGAVFDVAVDVRPGSPTYLRWHGQTLTDDNLKSLMIPEGFAHGFQALTDDAQLLYFHSAPHRPESERGVCPTDPAIAVAWPLEIAQLSDRDAAFPRLSPTSKPDDGMGK